MSKETSSYNKSLARFFIPLAIQSASQSLTYPLVAMVASRGPGGTVNLAGLAQSNTIMFLLGTIGGGLITTGMVFGKTREGYENFKKVNNYLSLIVLGLQTLISIPPISHFIFGTIIGLPVSIETPARTTFIAAIPLQFLFFLRNPAQVILYNQKQTIKASLSTIFRIASTAILSPIFCRFDLVGPYWAVVCLTIPVGIEAFLCRMLAIPYIPNLKSEKIDTPRKWQIFLFNFPLSIGGFLISLSSMALGSFIARAPQPEIMLPVYYLALGLVNPVTFAMVRMQAVVLTFPDCDSKDNRTLRFGITVGLIVGVLPLFFILPGIADWYYVNLQNLNPENLHLIRITALFLIFQPVCVAFRSHTEGMAACLKKPTSILTGHAIFLGTMTITSFFSLAVGIPGNLIGPCSNALANITAASIVRLSLKWDKKDASDLVRGVIPTQDES